MARNTLPRLPFPVPMFNQSEVPVPVMPPPLIGSLPVQTNPNTPNLAGLFDTSNQRPPRMERANRMADERQRGRGRGRGRRQ